MFVVGHQVSAKVGSGLSRGSPGVLVQTGSKQNGVGNEVVRKVLYQFGVGLLTRKQVKQWYCTTRRPAPDRRRVSFISKR